MAKRNLWVEVHEEVRDRANTEDWWLCFQKYTYHDDDEDDHQNRICCLNRLDGYFSTRKKALKWGRQKLVVKVRQD